jgi:RNA polymerase sigma-70 factor (ECF subfamily)
LGIASSFMATGKTTGGSEMHFPSRSVNRQVEACRSDFEEQDSDLVRKFISKAQEGDSEALRFLYVRHAPEVTRYLRRLLRDDHEAEDLTQDVFTKLLTVIPKYEPREVPFAAWVMRVARNIAIDYLRARRTIPCEEIRLQTADRERVGRERRRDLEQALNRLPTEQRTVFVLRHIVGLSPVEIASVLDRTESSIHGLHHRGRLSMQSSLRQLGTTPVVAA